MKLSTLIRKGGLTEIATATHATVATHKRTDPPLIARVATVAVATIPKAFDDKSCDERVAIIEANGVPREWAEGYATLCMMHSPPTHRLERWQTCSRRDKTDETLSGVTKPLHR